MAIQDLVNTLNSLYDTDARNQIAKFNKQARKQELEALASANARNLSSSGAFEAGMAKTYGENRSLGIGEILANASAAKSAAVSGATINDYMSDKAFDQQNQIMNKQRKWQQEDLLRDSLIDIGTTLVNPYAKAWGLNEFMKAGKTGMDAAKDYSSIFGVTP